MKLSFRNISLNTAITLFNCQDISSIYIILSDTSLISLDKDNQFIKYHFDHKNIVRLINPDLLDIYNNILFEIKKNFKTIETFEDRYYKNRTLLCEGLYNNLNYSIELITRIVTEIYINNSELKTKKANVHICHINITLSPIYILYFYHKKVIYHIEKIIISKTRLSDKKKVLYPELNMEQYQIAIYEPLNYRTNTLNKKNFYYGKNNKPIEESMKELETYLWIKDMIIGLIIPPI